MLHYQPFRFWCQKVLPLVYDDSLSYYELLAKVVDYLNKMGEDVGKLADYIDNIDIEDDVSKKLDEMAEDGTLDEIVGRYITLKTAVIDVSTMVEDRVLTSDNIAQAITDALEEGSYIYIPKGEYRLNVEISKDCTIYVDDECVLYTETQNPCIKAHDCSISIYGGNFKAGVKDLTPQNPDTVDRFYLGYPDTYADYGYRSIIRLWNCYNCHFENINVPVSKMWEVFYIHECTNVEIKNCKFDDFLNSAIFFDGHCVNVAVRNCKFTNALYAIERVNGSDEPRYYCYFVYTGLHRMADEGVTPVEGLIYENNYCNYSEDSGLDTHGAKNVIIRNNVILNAVCAITAYNDNSRTKRPAGWYMENILIENNYCESSRGNNANSNYKHPVVLLGAVNSHSNTESGYTTNPGSYNAYRHCVVRNNSFINNASASSGGYESPTTGVQFNSVARDVVFENNFLSFDNVNTALRCDHAINFKILNNVFDKVRLIYFSNNVSAEVDSGYVYQVADKLQQIYSSKGLYPSVNEGTVTCGGNMQYVGSNNFAVSQSYGNRVNKNYTGSKTFTVQVVNNVAKIVDGGNVVKHNMLPYMTIYLTDISDNRVSGYIGELIDFDNFSIANPTNLTDGTYILTLRDNFYYNEQSNLVPAVVNSTGASINVRYAPNASATVVGTLSNGSGCFVISRNSKFYNDEFVYVIGVSSGAIVSGYCGANLVQKVEIDFDNL